MPWLSTQKDLSGFNSRTPLGLLSPFSSLGQNKSTCDLLVSPGGSVFSQPLVAGSLGQGSSLETPIQKKGVRI